jgi:transglutaminase-like putative cysteine protease/tetratricopeptide (TPR) repeat protein
VRFTLQVWAFVLAAALSPALRAADGDVWSAPAFSVESATLRKAADTVSAEKQMEATVLLDEDKYEFDATGKLTYTRRIVYRVETAEGVRGWSDVGAEWEPWHQNKPEIKARVVTADGAEHWLDAKTLVDVPVHEQDPDVFSDARKLAGPLPAVAAGAIVETQVVTTETAPLLVAGTVHEKVFAWTVPVNRTSVTIIHPESLPLRYKVRQLPDATVTKSTANGIETVRIEQGPIRAFAEETRHIPSDVALYPEMRFSTAKSWQEVAADYAGLSEPKMREADVHAIVAKAGAKSGGREQVIEKLVAAMHTDVRYTGVEFGVASLVPEIPSETLKRKYGDCKDKAALLVTMLRAAGIPANLALLDSGPGRDLDPDLPGMGMFDHAIVYVPASGADPELWIDATAEHSQVGTLPWMDYDRWALIVSDKTDALKRTPQLTAAMAVKKETREFTLAPYGPAKIVETDEEHGPDEADYRDYYDGDTKEVREKSEEYVKSVYLAESLTALEHSNLEDMSKPAQVKFVAEGRRGYTDLNSAIVAIRTEALFDSLPEYFKTKEPAHPSEDSDEKKHPRTVDWWITPFTEEWHYKVTAPDGFKVRALPPDKNEKVGTLSFTQKYGSNADGTVVEGELRVENTIPRISVEDAKALRDAVVKAREGDPVMISFDNTGYALMAAGKIKEGLAAYKEVTREHPKEALPRVRFAQALLTAGLGEEARNEAREATKLEPSSALAYSTLGDVLKADLIGRAIKPGMDFAGATAAYRKAIVMGPKDKDVRGNLALLLEYDSNGVRYNDKAGLLEAVQVLRDLKKLDEDFERKYEDNGLYDLWYARDYKEVLAAATALPSNDVRQGMIVGATAALDGTAAALKKATELSTNDQARSKALLTAGAVLVRVRKYPEGAALFAEAARGQNDASQLTRTAQIFAKTTPYDPAQTKLSEPTGVLKRIMYGLLSGTMTLEDFNAMSLHDPDYSEPPTNAKDFAEMMSKTRNELIATGMPPETIADMTMSNTTYTVDGDDATGFKVIADTIGSGPRSAYVLKTASGYKLAGFSTTGSANGEDLAVPALEALDNGNTAGARRWLDWAREQISMGGGDDPLAGSPFPYFWTKGQEGDAETMRLAALVLLRSKSLNGKSLATVEQARASTKDDTKRRQLTMVITYAYQAQERWAEMLPVCEELVKAVPTSLRAYGLLTAAYERNGKLDDWQTAITAREKAYPDEIAYKRSEVFLATARGDFAGARTKIKAIMDSGKATASDLNLYAWNALFLPGPIDAGSIDAAQRADDMTSHGDFNILHTLGCVYAQSGNTVEAREIFQKAMDAAHLSEPNPPLWVGYGLVAEDYGISDAALRMYGRAAKMKVEQPGSTYSLAQRHVQALGGAAKAAGN